MINVLLINAEGVQTICMAKALRKLGCRVTGFSNSRFSSGYVSRWLDRRFKAPDITREGKRFREYFFDYLASNKTDIIIPLADDGAEFLSRNKDDIEKTFGAVCAVQEFGAFIRAADKNIFMGICDALAIPHPATACIDPDNPETAAAAVGFPALIKPDISHGALGIVKVENSAEMRLKLPEAIRKFKKCSLQQYISQPDHYYNVMMFRDSSGKISGTTVIKIMRYFPLKGGSSCYCETVDGNELKAVCEELLCKMNWRGFADIDILEDIVSGEFKVIELNPRVPSSLQAAFASDVDFAKLFLTGYLGGDMPEAMSSKPGIAVRWLGLDFMWFLKSDRRFRCKPSWFKFFGRNLSYQDFAYNDILPLPAGILSGILKYLNPEFRKSKLDK